MPNTTVMMFNQDMASLHDVNTIRTHLDTFAAGNTIA